MQKHLDQWIKSKVSAKSYCKTAGLNIQKFYYWRRKLPKSQGSFSDFTTITPEAYTGELQIQYPNGVRIILPSNSQTTLIRTLIEL